MAQAKRKKKFFEVELPLIKKQTQARAFEKKELEGKFIKYDLTRLLRGKATEIRLKIKYQDDKLTTNPIEIKILPYFLKKAVRKGTNYVEDSFIVNCKDAELILKPFLVTRRKVSRAVRKALREKAQEELVKYIKTKSSEDIFDEILKNRLQKTLSLKLKKIYPLSLCEIRILKVKKELETKKEIIEDKKSEIIEKKE